MTSDTRRRPGRGWPAAESDVAGGASPGPRASNLGNSSMALRQSVEQRRDHLRDGQAVVTMVADLDAIRLDDHACPRIDALAPEARPEVGRQDADLQHAIRAIEQLAHRRVTQRPQVDPRVLGMATREGGLAQQVGDHRDPEPLRQAHDGLRQPVTTDPDSRRRGPAVGPPRASIRSRPRPRRSRRRWPRVPRECARAAADPRGPRPATFTRSRGISR